MAAGDQPQSSQESWLQRLLELPTPTSSEDGPIRVYTPTPSLVECSTSASEPSCRDLLWTQEEIDRKIEKLRILQQHQLDTINKIHWDDFNSADFKKSAAELQTIYNLQGKMIPLAQKLCENEGMQTTETEIKQSLDVLLTEKWKLEGHARWTAFNSFKNALNTCNYRAWASLRSQIKELQGNQD